MPAATANPPPNNRQDSRKIGTKNRKLRPTTRRLHLGRMDGRTHEAKLFTQFKAELTAHVGGNPSVAQAAIIERCAWLRLRLALFDEKLAAGVFSDHDSAHYLAWANALSRLLERLGMQPAAPAVPQPMTFEQVCEDIARQKAATAAGEESA
jgi:hypothetical protein